MYNTVAHIQQNQVATCNGLGKWIQGYGETTERLYKWLCRT